MRTEEIVPSYGGKELIRNLPLLANSLGYRPKFVSHAILHKSSMQRPKDIDGRIVYSSGSTLKNVQRRLAAHLAYDFDQLEGTETAIACRKGLDVRKYLAKNAGLPVMVITDIVGYYDHVTKRKILTALKDLGYTSVGKMLIADLLVVERQIGHGENAYSLNTLQQGSPASNAMANIVGRLLFDIPIVKWVKENMPSAREVVRYSDNITLYLEEDPGQEKIEAYKTMVKYLADKAGFRTHGWATLRQNNKWLPQKFLGMVFNGEVSVSRGDRDRIRGIIFKALLRGVDSVAWKYFEERGIEGLLDMPPERIRSMFVNSVIGYAQYVMSVNPTHGRRLLKLAKLLERAVDEGKVVDLGKLKLIGGAGNDREETCDYLMRATKALV